MARAFHVVRSEAGAVCPRLLGMFFDRAIIGLRPTQGGECGSCSATTFPGSTALPFVISTGAYPDFLLRDAGNDHVCGFP
jgi:hypothetical protein